jgi:hypothetical protein
MRFKTGCVLSDIYMRLIKNLLKRYGNSVETGAAANDLTFGVNTRDYLSLPVSSTMLIFGPGVRPRNLACYFC